MMHKHSFFKNLNATFRGKTFGFLLKGMRAALQDGSDMEKRLNRNCENSREMDE